MQNLKVVGIQFDIAWQDKNKNIDYLNSKLVDLKGVDLIVLPEMFQTGFCFDEKLAENFQESKTIQWMQKWSYDLNSAIVGSLMIREKNDVYNRLVFIEPSGKLHTYDKRHLFSMSDEPNYISKGSKHLIIEYKGWRICTFICYDLRFPVWIRNVENYDLLIFVANWPERRSHHWQKLLEARAIENQSYVVGVNRVGFDGNGVYHDGKSAIINPMGEVLLQSVNKEEMLSTEIFKADLLEIREKMPFLKDRDNFKWDD